MSHENSEITEVAFAVDQYSEDCAFVAIHSMLMHAKSAVHVLILYDKHGQKPGKEWMTRVSSLDSKNRIRYIEVDISPYRSAKSLFNSWSNYLKLEAPNFALGDRLIYSDADVVFTADINELCITNMDGKILALNALSHNERMFTCQECPERERRVLYGAGRSPTDPYYGSGIALINCKEYLKSGIDLKCREIAAKQSAFLLFQDQTLWNCALEEGQISLIDMRWCQYPPMLASDQMTELTPGIIHFMGSPKPWDLFGEYFHRGHKLWAAAARAAGLRHHAVRKYFRPADWKRFNKIQKQYRRFF